MTYTPANGLNRESDLYKVALDNFYAAICGSRHVVQEMQRVSQFAQTAHDDCDAALRETWAQTRSMRYKDFDRVMNEVFDVQKKRTSELGASVNAYLDEQQELSRTILDELAALPLASSESASTIDETTAESRTNKARAMMEKFSELQKRRREELLLALANFKAEQQEFSQKLTECATRSKELRLQDVKLMFRSFQTAQEERRAQAEKRRNDVAELLAGFKQKRLHENI
jgi:hypothetical protein